MEQKLEPNSTVTIDFEYGGYDGCGLSHIEYNWVDSNGVLFFPKNDRYEPIEDYFVGYRETCLKTNEVSIYHTVFIFSLCSEY